MSPPKKTKKQKNHHRKTKASKQTNKKTPTTAKQQFCKEKQQHEKGAMKICNIKTNTATILSSKFWNTTGKRYFKKSGKCIAEKRLTFLCVPWSGKNKGIYVSPEVSELTTTYGSFYTLRRGNTMLHLSTNARLCSFIYCVYCFKVWPLPPHPPRRRTTNLPETQDLIPQADAGGCVWWIGWKFDKVRQTRC